MSLKGWFKKATCRHDWQRYDVLVEQLFTGGYCAWQKCPKCEKIKFAKAAVLMPEQPGWEDRKAEIDAIIKRAELSEQESD